MLPFPVQFTAGDTLPVIGGRWGSDITGYTITLAIKRPDDSLLEIEAEITDAEDGLFLFPWAADDLQEGTGQQCVVRMLNGDGQLVTSARFLINVAAVLE